MDHVGLSTRSCTSGVVIASGDIVRRSSSGVGGYLSARLACVYFFFVTTPTTPSPFFHKKNGLSTACVQNPHHRCFNRSCPTERILHRSGRRCLCVLSLWLRRVSACAKHVSKKTALLLYMKGGNPQPSSPAKMTNPDKGTHKNSPTRTRGRTFHQQRRATQTRLTHSRGVHGRPWRTLLFSYTPASMARRWGDTRESAKT